jgi:hypothetical protein
LPDWRFIQNSGVVPKYRANLSAVSGVMARRSLTISPIPRRRNSKIARDLINAYAEIGHELLAKNFTGVKRRSMQLFGHVG